MDSAACHMLRVRTGVSLLCTCNVRSGVRWTIREQHYSGQTLTNKTLTLPYSYSHARYSQGGASISHPLLSSAPPYSDNEPHKTGGRALYSGRDIERDGVTLYHRREQNKTSTIDSWVNDYAEHGR